ncbi:hypothetical protein [Pseudomonas sp. OV226]|uniref:hypothetical protein n=1 Tax=Pseudomonas sp. OV226 TaxID=2135588 RepID=UPI000D7A40DC|nr:hypothetical protein [Pseudomonas sp. OV226]PWK31438.1 hypothetical protein C7534_12388 [Pseudomonas sp. OV226]
MKIQNLKEGKKPIHLIDHPSLTPLSPHIMSYLKKGLTAMTSGNTRFPASKIENYANYVWEKVAELDTALGSLRLALKFVTELGCEPNPSPEAYRYHYENFVLRVIGFVDRAHRLVGASLSLPQRKYESFNGNAFVKSETVTNHPGIHTALVAVATAVQGYRGPRNELIHSTAYSSRELGLFIAVEHFGVDTGDVDMDELKREHSAEGSNEISKTIGCLVEALTALMEELGILFEAAHQIASAKAP